MNLRALLILLAALALASCGQEEAARAARENAEAARQEMEAEARAQQEAVSKSQSHETEPTPVSDSQRKILNQIADEFRARVDADDSVPTAADLIPWKRLDTPVTAEITVDWTEAADYDGQTIAVEGTIVDTHNSGKACFLNFSKEWQGTFYLAVLGSNMDDYPESPERYFLNKKVRAVGKVAMYRDRPQIVIESPLHITVLGE